MSNPSEALFSNSLISLPWSSPCPRQDEGLGFDLSGLALKRSTGRSADLDQCKEQENGRCLGPSLDWIMPAALSWGGARPRLFNCCARPRTGLTIKATCLNAV